MIAILILTVQRVEVLTWHPVIPAMMMSPVRGGIEVEPRMVSFLLQGKMKKLWLKFKKKTNRVTSIKKSLGPLSNPAFCFAGMGTTRQGYLPNITEHVVSRCGTPPSLNVVTNSQLFPAIQPTYGPRWSSQLPESYLPNPNGECNIVH